MNATANALAEPLAAGVLQVPPEWQAIDLIADLHLHPQDSGTLAALQAYLDSEQAQAASALIVLGDLFEVWIGDDALAAEPGPADLDGELAESVTFWNRCAALFARHARHRPIWFMAGNRDFLLGDQGLNACGMRRLADPTRLAFQGRNWLLSHGDALCLDDTAYMAFRQQVRRPEWREAFLARPLVERATMARNMRQQSQQHQRQLAGPEAWADVDGAAAIEWLRDAGCDTLIHGHTHRPGVHALAPGLERVVLSDWESGGPRPRAEVLRLDAQGWRRLPVPLPA
ncbi:MAG: UDP-2,3-diacylglucosamine diphosphatase [Burkholderiaceae bacterium]